MRRKTGFAAETDLAAEQTDLMAVHTELTSWQKTDLVAETDVRRRSRRMSDGGLHVRMANTVERTAGASERSERDGRRQSTPCKGRRVREGWWSPSRRTPSKGRQAPVNVQIGTAGASQRRVKDGGRVITATVKDGGRH